MTISLRYAHVTVTDVEESLAFYRDGLGLEMQNDVSYGGFRWATLGSPDQEGLGVVLSTPYAGRSQEDGDALQELLTKGVLSAVAFRVDNVDAVFEKLLSSGAEVMQEPSDQDWGPRDCAFRDPAGNLLRINQAG